jgi:chromosome segregation ATPase
VLYLSFGVTEMGRKALFTEEEVFQAADGLVAEGKEVTATTLLTALGGGSLTTIYKHLSKWQESRPASSVGAIQLEMPEPVLAAFGAAWRAAVSEAGRTITAVREKANEEVKNAQKQFQEALESIGRLESEAEEDGTKIEALNAKVEELEGSLRKTENERAGLAATVEQQQQRIKALEADVERLRQDAEAERKRHEGELARFRSESDAERKRHSDEAAQLNQVITAGQTEIEKLKKGLSESKVTNERTSVERDEALKRVEKAEKEVAGAKKERESAVSEAAELRGKVEVLTQQNADLLARLGPKQEKKS